MLSLGKSKFTGNYIIVLNNKRLFFYSKGN
nr:MAG TPA: hypothetical protein [Caudoviricetes sp.]